MPVSDAALWVPSPCFTHPRESAVDVIVLHWMDTDLAGADATFTSGVRQASAHYGIENTTIHQYVREGDASWNAGVRSVNHRSVGIEHSAAPGRPATEATILTSIALCTELCQRYSQPASIIHQHNEFYATQCPGTLPVARIRAAVAATLAGHPVALPASPTPPIPTGFPMALTDVQQQAMFDRVMQIPFDFTERALSTQGAAQMGKAGTDNITAGVKSVQAQNAQLIGFNAGLLTAIHSITTGTPVDLVAIEKAARAGAAAAIAAIDVTVHGSTP